MNAAALGVDRLGVFLDVDAVPAHEGERLDGLVVDAHLEVQCEPKEWPVLPTSADLSPACTIWPSLTSSLDEWP